MYFILNLIIRKFDILTFIQKDYLYYKIVFDVSL